MIDWCVRLINDFMQTARDKDMVDAVIKYDAANQSQYQIFKSCILLGNECRLENQPTTKLVGDWFADRRVVALINDPETNASVLDEITGVFIYSNVDPGHGLDALKNIVVETMEGADKTGESYDGVLSAHTLDHDRYPPIRVKGGEFPEDSEMNNANYATVEAVLNEAVVAVKPKGGGIKRFRERAEETQEKPVEKPQKKSKTRRRGEETTMVKAETVETETDETNYALWGGLAAVTAGISAIAFSRRRRA